MYLFYACGQTICSYLLMLQGYKHVAACQLLHQYFPNELTTVAEQLFFRFVHFYVQR